MPLGQNISVQRQPLLLSRETSQHSHESTDIRPFCVPRTIFSTNIANRNWLSQQPGNYLPLSLTQEKGKQGNKKFVTDESKEIEIDLVECATEAARQVTAFQD